MGDAFETVEVDARRFVGLRATFGWADTSGIPAHWDAFGEQIESWPAHRPVWGLSLRPEAGDPAEGFDYMPAVESDATPTGRMTHVALPAGTWAKFRHEGPLSGMPASCRAAFGAVEASPEWHHAGGPLQIAEEYGADFDPGTGKGGVDLWVPVTRA